MNNDVSIGIVKNSKRVGEGPKENTRASPPVIRPRAVLSSPGLQRFKTLFHFK
ncbi:unnamed protein product [Trifolium pratense]|uniref:Uncharacterized protein n=1 Tax=Trifolium pratense TaxID=57577 RepID=A0ACB0K382_TRIPR|nr:unnamed protein product [Trifolium pratense]